MDIEDKQLPTVIYKVNQSIWSTLQTRQEFFNLRDAIQQKIPLITNSELQFKMNLLQNYIVAFVPFKLNRDSLYTALKNNFTTAKIMGNDIYTALACEEIGLLNHSYESYAETLFYLLKSLELEDKIGSHYFPGYMDNYYMITSAAYNTAQYRDLITYAMKSNFVNDTSETRKVNFYNTTGLAYQRMKLYDSALYWYNTGLDTTAKYNLATSAEVIKGNIGILYYETKRYNEALPILMKSVHTGFDMHDYPNTCNTLQWAARIYSIQQKQDSAYYYLHTCFSYMPRIKNFRFKKNIFDAAVLIYKNSGREDSAWIYMDSSNMYRDSMNHIIEASRLSTLETQLEFDSSMEKIETLQNEKKAEVIKRNLAIISVLLLGISALLFWNRKKLQMQHKQKLIENERAALAKEAEAAKQQIDIITQSLISKNELVEKLHQQLQNQEFNNDKQEKIDALLQEVILTEEDWARYRNLFDKVHPGFLNRLREKVPDITIAEQRIAALTRLLLDNKQMAGILGISADSVSKSKRRLRQRLNLAPEINLENYLATI